MAGLAKAVGVSPLLARMLLNRGLDTPEKAEAFLHPERGEYNDPFLLPDMAEAVERIRAAILGKEKIVVYGDYDADGVTASTVLLKTLWQLGGVADYYIPDRFKEGYGIHLEALQKLAAQGTRLVITVDCGIRSVEDLAAMAGQLDFVVTDHHLPGDELPPAVAVVNAHRKDSRYPCPELAGVGVAFKLCQALWQTMRPGEKGDFLLEVVALGTVADAVPLVGENRKIVAEGLKRMQNTKVVGLQALIEVAGMAGKKVDSTAIGFFLGPRINAAGRLQSASLSLELLLAEDGKRAAEIAEKLNGLNTERKALKARMQAMAEEQLAGLDMENAKAVVVAGKDWHHGVLGLVASGLQEKYYLPTVVISLHEGVGKGSCRSIEGFNLFEGLTNSAQALLQFGGHEMAAGLTLREENVDELRRLLELEADRQLKARQFIQSYAIDAEISPLDLTLEMVEELALLEPCGMHNPSPLFACRGLRGCNADLRGAEGKHLKFSLRDRGRSVDAIAFNMAEELPRVSRNAFDMVYEADINEWRDMRSVQCRVKSLDEPVPELRHVAMGRDFLKDLYLFCRQRVRQGANLPADAKLLAKQANIVGWGVMEEDVAKGLQVFLELGLLFRKGQDGRYLGMADTEGKMRLANSPTYRRLTSR